MRCCASYAKTGSLQRVYERVMSYGPLLPLPLRSPLLLCLIALVCFCFVQSFWKVVPVDGFDDCSANRSFVDLPHLLSVIDVQASLPSNQSNWYYMLEVQKVMIIDSSDQSSISSNVKKNLARKSNIFPRAWRAPYRGRDSSLKTHSDLYMTVWAR